MQYTDNEAALIGCLISNYFLRPAVSAALKDSYIHVLEHLHAGRVSAADCENHKSSEMLPTYASAAFFLYIYLPMLLPGWAAGQVPSVVHAVAACDAEKGRHSFFASVRLEDRG